MKYFDLSHRLNNESPVYPGTKKPSFIPASTLEVEGYRETQIKITSHLGTHIDSPAHMLSDGITLDQYSLDSFVGAAMIINVPEGSVLIEKSFFVHLANRLPTVDFVLIKTGWSRYWGSQQYFDDYPVLTPDATKWLMDFSLKGIGFDCISADSVESTSWENHHVILSNGAIIIENIIFPKNLTTSNGTFFCFPVPFEGADGSPVRAVFAV